MPEIFSRLLDLASTPRGCLAVAASVVLGFPLFVALTLFAYREPGWFLVGAFSLLVTLGVLCRGND